MLDFYAQVKALTRLVAVLAVVGTLLCDFGDLL